MKKLYFILLCLGLFSSLNAQNLPSYLPANGLVGWWPFNGNAQDESGIGNHGTVNGATLTTDRFGNANQAFLFFTSLGGGDIELNGIELSDNFSISCWVNLSQFNPVLVSTILSRYGIPTETGWELNATFDQRGIYGILGQESVNGNALYSSSQLQLNSWKHLVWTKQNSSSILCLDGLVIYQTTIANPISSNTGKTFIGRAQWGGNSFQGKIDDIAIYNRALTQQEITQLYQAGNETSLSYQLSQEKLGNCKDSPVKLAVQTSVRLKTDSAGNIGSSSAMAYGNILNDGGKTITRRGFCWSTSANPTLSNSFSENGSGSGTFSGSLSGLSPSTTYYLRAYAGTATEVWYGNEISFTTISSTTSASCGTPNIHNPNLSYGSMIDQDGNSYKTIVIGTQEWMAENLKVSHFQNGDVIPQVSDQNTWSGLTSPGTCWYQNDSSSFDCPYGKIYNWYAASDSRNMCPAGWHVPTQNDWIKIENYLGGGNIAGRKLKSRSSAESGSGLWNGPITELENVSGFSAVPNGWRNLTQFEQIGNYSTFWGRDEYSINEVVKGNHRILNLEGNFFRDENYNYKSDGYAVRCLKDPPETGSINNLDCGADLNLGQIYAGQPASGAITRLSYTGGNGGAYPGSVISSTGVTGLTASFLPGRFAIGDSILTLNISGTPSGTGQANFELNLGGQAFTISRLVIAQGIGATDIDGNQYPSVVLGNQEWLSENLKVTRYRNGDSIRTNLSDSLWSILDYQFNPVGANAIYDNDINLNSIYGKLYNWYSVADPRILCPSGWRIPADEDWTQLSAFLGCQEFAGRKMKTGSGGLWNADVGGTTNESGFNSVPGGVRSYDFPNNIYMAKGDISLWWSSFESGPFEARFWQNWTTTQLSKHEWGKRLGISVRCIRGEANYAGSIDQMNCSGMDTTGMLIEQSPVSGFTYFTIPYSGGNGGSHPGQHIISTGVSGLTATLFAGQFANGNGVLTYYIQGKPLSGGVANFAVNIGGKTCSVSWQVLLPASLNGLNCGNAVSTGLLTAGNDAGGFSFSIPYSGSNGGYLTQQIFASSGVTGLSASCAPGMLMPGSGNLVFTISGTPQALGAAGFQLTVGGQSCYLSFTVYESGMFGSNASCGTPDVHNPGLPYGTMFDQDGNSYKTIQIGNQTWMAENLKTGHFRNGDLIQVVEDSAEWSQLSSAASCWYENNGSLYDCPFGRLYNWYSVADPRGLCPDGWHVPDYFDWTNLSLYIDPLSETSCLSCDLSPYAGGKIKSAGTVLWQTPNAGGFNETGFSALPSGFRSYQGNFSFLGQYSGWWPNYPSESGSIWYNVVSYKDAKLYLYSNMKGSGFSVRCLKD
jgi:uncharacterized protein (TIGR02145 family)